MSSFDFLDWLSNHPRGCALGFDDDDYIIEFLSAGPFDEFLLTI